MIEIEKTYLAKSLPKGLNNCKFKEIIDVYIPKTSETCQLRLRKSGTNFEMTKKFPVENSDTSIQIEETITLNEIEFEALNSQLDGKKVEKIRYYYKYGSNIAEFDVFKGELKGLVLIDFEFENEEEMNQFETPEFCLVEVTQEHFLAGGIICGKAYADVEGSLSRFNYKKLHF